MLSSSIRAFSLAALFAASASVLASPMPEPLPGLGQSKAASKETSVVKRATGGFGFNNPFEHFIPKGGSGDAVATSSVDEDLDHRLETMGLTLLHSEQFGQVRSATWSLNRITPNLAVRDEVNIEGAKCDTQCGFYNSTKAIPEDCKVVYDTLYSKASRFSVQPSTVVYYTFEDCAAFIINNTPSTVATYDFWDLGGTTQYLNGHCIMQQSATVGVCLYEQFKDKGYGAGVYSSVNHRSYYG